MDGPIDLWWKMDLLDVCIQASFCQIQSHFILKKASYDIVRCQIFLGAVTGIFVLLKKCPRIKIFRKKLSHGIKLPGQNISENFCPRTENFCPAQIKFVLPRNR